MKAKIISIFLCILIITLVFPVIGYSNCRNDIKDNDNSPKFFISCYIETILYGDFETTGAHPEFGMLLFMPENENRETTIYSEKGGDILWHQEEKHTLYIGLFIGYNSVIEYSSKMCGIAFFVRTI